jgi:hypothetical protein
MLGREMFQIGNFDHQKQKVVVNMVCCNYKFIVRNGKTQGQSPTATTPANLSSSLK